MSLSLFAARRCRFASAALSASCLSQCSRAARSFSSRVGLLCIGVAEVIAGILPPIAVIASIAASARFRFLMSSAPAGYLSNYPPLKNLSPLPKGEKLGKGASQVRLIYRGKGGKTRSLRLAPAIAGLSRGCRKAWKPSSFLVRLAAAPR